MAEIYNNDNISYRHNPSVEEEVSDAGYEDILDYIMREGPGILKSGAKTGINTLVDYLTKPAGFKGSHQLISEGQQSTPEETAYSNTELDYDKSSFLNEALNQMDEWFNPLHLIEAAQIAKKSKSKSLILTHISQRYEHNPEIILNEAKKVFRNTTLAKDFDKIEI